ncbi:DEAD/DEAH box helicase [Vibrio porteresiae]|uniref:DEAD/DEAH box helicase n=1 Tax=Vibrio porteresiae DSM 19223 TaxID=1123496 RepID=A0ABZ0Q975_9VIBR|nr:DEAD/DEAH box helicase [Vibrio porteresiae]WPC72465.1 DEAD/DEAH box helicase [Vibrio porteresiae DSM 19223]
MLFSTLPLSQKLVTALPASFSNPTEIQTLSIPTILHQQDVLAIAQTGSGKTLAYGLPLLEQAMKTPSPFQALVLVPTRELATQVNEALGFIAQHLNVQSLCLCGGIDKELQKADLAKGPQIVVATPGRLLELLTENAFDASHISTLVLDEADRMLDMGFWNDVQRIIEMLPTQRQTVMFSATFPEPLENKAKALLNKPKFIQVAQTEIKANAIQETLYLVNKGSKTNVLIDQIKQHHWQQVLVFIGSKDNADALCKKLNKAGLSTAALHGNKDQADREATLNLFKEHKVDVLIATDLLARGIHVEDLPVVINFELPSNPEVYVHRIGRTARAGKTGIAISLVCHGETDYLAAIRQTTQRALPLKELEGYPVTDKPSTGESKRAPRDKQANRRTNQKKSIKQFQSKKKQ